MSFPSFNPLAWYGAYRSWLLRAKKVYAFITPKVWALVGIRTLLCVVQFLNEVGVAFCLLSFFARMGTGMIYTSTRLGWIDKLPGTTFTALFALVIISRGAIEWLDTYLYRTALENFRLRHRQRLVAWLFHSKSIDSSRFFTLWDQDGASTLNTLDFTFGALRMGFAALLLFAMLLYLSFLVTLPLLFSLVVISLPLRRISKISQREGAAIHSSWVNVHSRLLMSAKNLLLLRIHGMLEKEAEIIGGKLKENYVQLRRHGIVSSFVTTYVYILGTAFMLLLAYVQNKQASLAISHLVPYLYLLNRFLNLSLSFLSWVPHIRFGLPAVMKVANWWAEHADDGVRGTSLYKPVLSRPFKNLSKPFGWELKGVTLKFPDRAEPVIKDFDLVIKPGASVVIVGESGSGKSTLLSLLIGELDPTSGSIIVRHDRETRSLDECRSEVLPHIGYVGAESFLIGGTLRNNITYGLNRSVSDAELNEAVEKAQCQFIYDLNRGLDHELTDQGQGLSMGQKQRLCLARALLRQPRVLILDEATANLDEETEKNLIRLLAPLKGKLTIVAATHRKSFLALADDVIELKNGSRTSPRQKTKAA